MQCTALPSSLVALPQGTRGKTTQQLPRNVVWDHGQARLEVPSGVVWSGLTLQRSPGLSWTEMLLGFVGKQPYLWDFLQGDGWGALLLPQSSSRQTGIPGCPSTAPALELLLESLLELPTLTGGSGCGTPPCPVSPME